MSYIAQGGAKTKSYLSSHVFCQTKGSALIQYVDNLLVCAPTEEQCRSDSLSLLRHLSAEGHKVSLLEPQWVQEKVIFLGRVLNAEDKQFVQTVDEKGGHMTSVLLQKHSDKLRPVGYYYCKLDPVAPVICGYLSQPHGRER